MTFVKKTPPSNRQWLAVSTNESVSVLMTEPEHVMSPTPGHVAKIFPTTRFGYEVVSGCSTASELVACGLPAPLRTPF